MLAIINYNIWSTKNKSNGLVPEYRFSGISLFELFLVDHWVDNGPFQGQQNVNLIKNTSKLVNKDDIVK